MYSLTVKMYIKINSTLNAWREQFQVINIKFSGVDYIGDYPARGKTR